MLENEENSRKNVEDIDIFISYRRDGGEHVAWRFHDALKNRHYRPFMDYDGLIGGQFDAQLYDAIDHCKDFILILPPNALDRCINEGDWVRLEVERAAEDRKNIIPVRMENFKYPDVLPESLEFLKKQQSFKLYSDLFDDFIDKKIVPSLKSEPVIPESSTPIGKKVLPFLLGLIVVCGALFGFLYMKHLPPFQLSPTVTPTPVVISSPTDEPGDSIEELASKGEAAYQTGNYESALLSLIPAAEGGNDAAQFRLGWMYSQGEGLEQSYEQAFKWYQEAAEQGNTDAQTNLGWLYSHGKVSDLSAEQADEKAVEWYQKAADQGNAGAQYNLGVMYENGRGAAYSYEKALEYYQKAAAQGDVDAQFCIGKMYDNGLGGLDKSEEEALSWYLKAADLGHAEAQFWVGVHYENGQGVEKNNAEALLWYRKSADQGYPEGKVSFSRLQREVNAKLTPSPTNTATFTPTATAVPTRTSTPMPTLTSTPVPTLTATLSPTPLTTATLASTPSAAELFSLGEKAHKDKDYVKALEYLLPAAEAGSSNAQFRLGYMYSHGEGVDQSDEKAAEWYQKSAEGGNSSAQVSLGAMYYDGKGGLEKNPKESVRLFRLAADQNSSNGQTWLGFCYEYGYGVEQDYEEALHWYQLAADQGSDQGKRYLDGLQNKMNATPTPTPTATLTPTPSAAELFSLGIKAYGAGDFDKAVEYFIPAAEGNDANAQYYLGWMYESGRGVPQDEEKAADWYQKAADQGNSGAQVSLGHMYYDGRGVLEKDLKEAARLFRLSAEQNNVNAMEWMGVCYERGHGVEKNLEEAIRWYRLALDKDSEYAKNALERLGQSVETQPSNGAVIRKDVLLMSKPSSVSDIMRSVLKDSTVTLLGESRKAEGKNWIFVRTQAGLEGWIPESAVMDQN